MVTVASPVAIRPVAIRPVAIRPHPLPEAPKRGPGRGYAPFPSRASAARGNPPRALCRLIASTRLTIFSVTGSMLGGSGTRPRRPCPDFFSCRHLRYCLGNI